MKAFVLSDNKENLNQLYSFIDDFFSEVKIVGHSLFLFNINQQIDDLSPDFVIVDISPAGQNFYEHLKQSTSFWINNNVIMVSDPSFALNAISLGAIHFISSPITFDAFQSALNKVSRILNITQTPQNTFKTIAGKDAIGISSFGIIRPIIIDDIVYLKADGRYTHFHLKGNRKITASKNIGAYDKMLVDSKFIRIHQSFLINIEFVDFISTKEGLYVILRNPEIRLPVSKRRLKTLVEFFQF